MEQFPAIIIAVHQQDAFELACLISSVWVGLVILIPTLPAPPPNTTSPPNIINVYAATINTSAYISIFRTRVIKM
jgi:hypothetical protein